MRTLALLLISAISLASSSAFAASYQQRDGTIVDPIQPVFGGSISYSGINLEPGANLTGANLTDASLGFADLFGANLTGANLSNAQLTDANLTNSNLSNAILTNSWLISVDLTNADMSNAILFDANLTNSNLSNAILTNADLRQANFANTDLRGADFSGATVVCSNTNSPGLLDGQSNLDATTNFSGLDLRSCGSSGRVRLGRNGGIYEGSNLSHMGLGLFSNFAAIPGSQSGWNFNSADLASAYFVGFESINFRDSTAVGVYAPFVDWFINPFDATGFDPPRYQAFTNSCIRNMDFTDADLTGSRFGPNTKYCPDLTESDRGYLEFSANFTRAKLAGASFRYVISDFTDFTNAYMPGVDMTGATLRNAVFHGALLSGSTFDNTDLRGADFSGADLSYTVFVGNIAGSPTYDQNTSFANAYILMGGAPFDPDGASWVPFNPAAAGWKAAPEPGFTIGAAIGVLALASIRNRRSLRH